MDIKILFVLESERMAGMKWKLLMYPRFLVQSAGFILIFPILCVYAKIN